MNKIEKLKFLWNDRDNQLMYARWLAAYTKPYVGRISFMMLINVGQTAISLIMAVISKKIIDQATNGARNQVLHFIMLYAGLIILTQVVAVAYNLFSTMLEERFSFGIRKQLYEKILKSNWLEVQKYHSGDLMTRLTSDAESVSNGIINTIPSIITLFIQLIMVFFTLFYYSPLLAIFALMIAPVAGIVAWLLGGRMKKLQVKVQETEAKYRSFMQESIANLMIVKSFANEEYSTKRLTELRENRFFWVFKRTKFASLYSTILSMTFQSGYIVAFTYGALLLSAGTITYGTMSIFLTLVNRVQSPILQLAQQVPAVVSILASAGRIIEIQDIVEEEKLDETITPENIGVDVQKVTFGYTDEIILSEVDLQIKPGEMVAVIGESGIGKTTLIRLVMAFMSANSGQISFFNEKGERVEGNANCRSFISYVPQGNTLFSGTVRENIHMGRLDATEEEMWEALEMASGADFVRKLPDGIDTVIGERGHGISEGQAQRVAIARALVRKAPFLILDEATSSLDEQTELKVLEGIQRLDPKPTCLVITHRKSILKYCDKELEIVQQHFRKA